MARMSVNMAADLPGTGRITRRPRHTFAIRARPWQAQPFFIAPVLAGETMKNLNVQARVVSDPVKNKLAGWWHEKYFFYVKLRDLAGRDDFVEMLLDQAKDMSAYNTAATVRNYHFGSGIDWTQLCLDRVIAEYFRNEGEAITVATIDSVPLVSINDSSWLDSAVQQSLLDAVDIDLSDAGSPGGTAVLASEIEAALRNWELLSQEGVIAPMTFEDYCRTFGVRLPTEEIHKPELVRYVRDWTYPTNTVEPTTGVPSSALSWSIAERADKSRFFKEPGFLFGVCCSRPKVYLKNIIGSAASLMDDMFAWLPAILANDARSSQIHIPDGAGPFQTGAGADGYVVDIKDLLLYGDQFINFALSATDANIVDLPSTALQYRYASSTDADSLFVDAAGGKKLIREDGVVSLNILGRQVDTTPTAGRTIAF